MAVCVFARSSGMFRTKGNAQPGWAARCIKRLTTDTSVCTGHGRLRGNDVHIRVRVGQCRFGGQCASDEKRAGRIVALIVRVAQPARDGVLGLHDMTP